MIAAPQSTSVVLAATLSTPWRQLLAAPLPAIAAIDGVVHWHWRARAILACVIFGILATWNSTFLRGSRLLYALGRDGAIPGVFARTGWRQSPTVAIALMTALGALGLCLGRGALIPIINMASISLTIAYALSSWSALRLRPSNPTLPRPYRVPGGTWTMRFAVTCTLASWRSSASSSR